MRKIYALITTLTCFLSVTVNAGLPPTTTRGVADSSNTPTFNINFGSIPVTHSTVTATVGTIPTAQGGTNLTSYTLGDLLYASATNVLAKLGIGSAGQILAVSSGIPAWISPDTTTASGQIASVTAATYTLLTTEIFVKVDTTSNAISIQLPNPNTYRRFYLKDIKGNLNVNALTLVRNGSEKIESLTASYVIYAPFFNGLVWSDGTDWWIN